MDPDTDVYQTGQPQISYSFDFTAEQSLVGGVLIIFVDSLVKILARAPPRLRLRLQLLLSPAHAPFFLGKIQVHS